MFLSLLLTSSGTAAEVIEPKVMVIATYETGKDRGDVPGELQFWVERENLDQSIKVPGIEHPILTNGKGLYAMICSTTSRCSVQMMTLAMDPRFDLRHTYFLLSGIAGADPAAGPLSSAAWIEQVVDGDPIFEIDSREIPRMWRYGTIALGADEPGKIPANAGATQTAGISEEGAGEVGKMVYQINPSLVEWSYQLTKDVTIPDTPELAAWRERFKDFPNAQHLPKVERGASLGTNRFWHGAVMNKWAQDWVRLYTKGTGVLVMDDCEDQGLCLAMEQLDRLGRIDFHRFLILRSGSNFTVPPFGVPAEKSLFENLANAPGYLPSLEADYRVGSVVTSTLLRDWDKYRDHVP